MKRGQQESEKSGVGIQLLNIYFLEHMACHAGPCSADGAVSHPAWLQGLMGGPDEALHSRRCNTLCTCEGLVSEKREVDGEGQR